MAVDPVLAEPSPSIRFTRYLYVGKEYPVYHSNPATSHLTLEKFPSLEELASSPSTALEPLEKIKSLFPNTPHPDILIFALAACTRQETSEILRSSAFKFLGELKDVDQFLLYISLASKLSQRHCIPSHGFGCGWRNAVNRWYLEKAPKVLADIVTKQKSRFGWSHKDLLKLAHPVSKGLAPELQAIFQYIVLGLEETKLSFSKDSIAQEILEFLDRVEDFRRCEDPIRASGLIRIHGYTLDHVHPSLLKSQDVWEALIETMNLPTLVSNLQRLQDNGLITVGSQITEKIITAFTNQEQVMASKIRPSALFLALKNYENPDSVPMPMKRRISRKNKLKHKTIPKADRRIVDAIYSGLNLSFSNVEATGLKYLITVSTWKKQNDQVHAESTAPWVVEGACILILGLLRADDKVTVPTFTGAEGLNARFIHIEKNANFQETVDRMRIRSTAPPNLGKPMLWAAHHRRKYDVFINVVDRMREKYDFTGRALDLYKKKMNLPKSRLVNWVVGSASTYMEGRNVNDILTVCGFDAHVPKIIEAFARHQF